MRAFVIGGSGLVGRATCRRLLSAGWNVAVLGRDATHVPADLTRSGVQFFAAGRGDADAVAAAFGSGADLLVDCVCYTARHATELLPLAGNAGSTVMISSKAVYVDAEGRHANSDEPPRYGGPVHESQPTVTPGDMDFNSREGYGRNKVAAENVLLDSGFPVTVLRPSTIHGEGARPARTWYFVKRILDQRRAVLLANRGRGVDHPSAAANIASLIETVAIKPASRILNSADPDAPGGLEIAQVVARHLDHEWQEVLLGENADPTLGAHPWDRIPPVVLDTTAATDLGYTPAGDFATTVSAEIDWLVALARGLARTRYTDSYFDALFDYAREDRYLAEHREPPAC